MIRAYKVVAEDSTTRTYEYATSCSYWVYVSLAVASVGYLGEIKSLMVIGMTGLGAYFLLIWFPALADANRIKAAIRTHAGEISGSRWSFRNPLRIRVHKKDD